MTGNRLSRAGVLGLAVLGVLAAVWVLPPAMHRLRHLCPVRPDGVAQSYAVPSYARKYGVNCSMCHVNWPILNDVGRKFKENGYVLDREGENKEASGMMLPKAWPMSTVIKSELFGKEKFYKPEIKGIHDIALFLTDGSIGKNFSLWSEYHFRDFDAGATPTAFGFTFERARLGYHYNPYLNAYAGFGSIPEGMDLYETLESPNHTMVANHVTDILDHMRQPLVANTVATPDATKDPQAFDQQYVGLGGSVGQEGVGAVKYWTAVGGGWGGTTLNGGVGNDPVIGQGPMNLNFRLVLDTLKGFALGGYYQTGHEGWSSSKTSTGVEQAASGAGFLGNIQTYAVDALAEAKGFAARGAFIKQRETVEDGKVAGQTATGLNLSDRQGAYVEALYTLSKDNAPWISPLIRYETLGDTTAQTDPTGNKDPNGTKKVFHSTYKDYVVASLSYFPWENVHAIAEYWLLSRSRAGGLNAASDNKVQFQVAIGF